MKFPVNDLSFTSFGIILAARIIFVAAGITISQRIQFLDGHNAKRRIPSATLMKRMTWDSELENLAQSWAEGCIWDHRPGSQRKTSSFSSVGENIYAGTGSKDATSSIGSWYDEVNDYNITGNTCKAGAVCGHYTQVVWASSYKLGCGMTVCPTMTGLSFINATYIVCNYGPAGNYNGQSPYTKGTKCSSCSGDHSTCKNGLCASDTCDGKTCQNSGKVDYNNCLCTCTANYTGFNCETELGDNSNDNDDNSGDTLQASLYMLLLTCIISANAFCYN